MFVCNVFFTLALVDAVLCYKFLVPVGVAVNMGAVPVIVVVIDVIAAVVTVSNLVVDSKRCSVTSTMVVAARVTKQQNLTL